MGKRGQRKGGHEDNPTVPEATRIQISKRIEEFRLGNAEVYTFEPTLSNPERAWVHAVCRKTGMISKSTGRGNQRCVSVYKSKKRKQGEVGAKKASLKDKESLTSLTFSDETKAVLRDLFTHYPPIDGELGKETVRNLSAKISKGQGKQDGCFCLPSMTKDEIAKKADLLSSKINGTKHMRKISEGRSKLPIASFKDAITSTIESHQVVLIAGETGCGKTTQVPQFLLDYMWGKGEACKIVCTQPRRISAISVAERISYERGENVGESVGYKIRLESKGGKNSSIMFCTNGILLRVLIGMGNATSKDGGIQKIRKDGSFQITHIIVDEIHERDRFADFMLAILRDQLRLFPHLHLILMSATIDAERFSQYFNGCPIIRVPGFTYPVKTYYLEDVLSILKSTDDNHIGSAASTNEDANQLSEDDRIAMDDSINVALSNDEFEPLLELISAETTPRLYNYQHSLTGATPLMVLAGNGSVSDVCMLLSFGADCDLRDKEGKTALDWAQQANQDEVADIIKTHKEKGNSKSQEEQQLLEKYLASVNPELIDTALIERLLKKICVDSEDGAVLVFLPGWDDINRTREALLASPLFRDSSKFLIISLHSMIPSMEQKKVFKRPATGIRKIILSTNIAETAITIDDVVYVIDSGWMKEKSYDPYNNVSTLHSAWVSKASAKQREGRAGRCQAGICYHLFSRTRAAALPDFQVPEIKRMPIEELCLQVKLMDPHSKIVDFIQKTMDPPVFETIRNAIIVLQDIGALTHDEMLTELGQKMGSLPVHPSTSKMLFFAIMMNCLDPALTLACASDYRDPFILPMALEERKKAKAAKIELASFFGGLSDQLMVTAAFECWRRAKDKGQESQFCSRYFLSASTMNMLFAMRQQLQKELTQNGFIPEDTSNCSLNAHDPGILHAVLVSGLYPMVGRLIPRKGRRAIVETASGAKVLLHPHSVNFKSFNSINNSPLIIYDEITRGDGGMYIKNCTAVGPYPLLLLANEMVVAPANDDGEESDEEEEISGSDDEEMELCGGKQGDRLMSSPDNTVSVVVDRWLTFESTALDVAQLYCLRERLSSAVLFKVKHPRKVLPPALGASVYAMACILSYDGLSGISQNAESMDSLESMVGSTGDSSKTLPRGKKTVGKNCGNSVGYLRSLMYDGTQRNSQPQLDNKKMANAHKKDPPSRNNLVSQRSTSTNPAQDHTGGGVLSKRGSFKRQRGSWPR